MYIANYVHMQNVYYTIQVTARKSGGVSRVLEVVLVIFCRPLVFRFPKCEHLDVLPLGLC